MTQECQGELRSGRGQRAKRGDAGRQKAPYFSSPSLRQSSLPRSIVNRLHSWDIILVICICKRPLRCVLVSVVWRKVQSPAVRLRKVISALPSAAEMDVMWTRLVSGIMPLLSSMSNVGTLQAENVKSLSRSAARRGHALTIFSWTEPRRTAGSVRPLKGKYFGGR